MNSSYWRFIIFLGLGIAYCLLIYASIKPAVASSSRRGTSTHEHGDGRGTSIRGKQSNPDTLVIPSSPPIIPKSLMEEKVTAFVKVHLRPDIAVKAAFSVYKLYPQMNIIMVDDSPDPILEDLPPTAKYFRIPEKTGISYGRNFGVNQTQTEYLLIMDDDWLVTNLSHLKDAFNLLEKNHSLDIVAGFLCMKEPMDSCYGYQGSLGIIDNILTYKDKEAREDLGNGCKIVDLAENVILARTDVLRKYPWDNQLTNAEHEDFYLVMKGHVTVASCNWFKMLHKRPSLADYPRYVEDRDLSKMQDRLCRKWNLRGFNLMWSEWQRPCPAA